MTKRTSLTKHLPLKNPFNHYNVCFVVNTKINIISNLGKYTSERNEIIYLPA